MSEWHGWSRGGGDDQAREEKIGLHIGLLPGRKRPCLYTASTNALSASCVPLAYFLDEEAAQRALEILDQLILDKHPPKPRRREIP